MAQLPDGSMHEIPAETVEMLKGMFPEVNTAKQREADLKKAMDKIDPGAKYPPPVLHVGQHVLINGGTFKIESISPGGINLVGIKASEFDPQESF